jgi:hypothetical protein
MCLSGVDNINIAQTPASQRCKPRPAVKRVFRIELPGQQLISLWKKIVGHMLLAPFSHP